MFVYFWYSQFIINYDKSYFYKRYATNVPQLVVTLFCDVSNLVIHIQYRIKNEPNFLTIDEAFILLQSKLMLSFLKQLILCFGAMTFSSVFFSWLIFKKFGRIQELIPDRQICKRNAIYFQLLVGLIAINSWISSAYHWKNMFCLRQISQTG